MDEHQRNLKCRRIQCDEIWSFVGAKERTIKKDPTVRERNPNAGDWWTWLAIDADSKLIVSFAVGGRTAAMAHQIMDDVASRLAHRVQLTTDGLHQYLDAVEDAFLGNIDYAQLVKIYNETGRPGRYSPPECIGAKSEIVQGDPDPKHINTSYIERQNLTLRMSNRRFTRLTNAFSKKVENHMASLALHYMHYNFCRVHQTLRVTPAMEAGLTDHVWSLGEMVALLD
jgi:IS1 family transposase